MPQDNEHDIDALLKQFEAQQKELDKELEALALPNLDDPDFDPMKGYPPIVKATSEASDSELTETLQKILDEGADPNSTSPYGETAIGMAFQRGNMQAVRLLYEHGASLEEFNWTPLHRAVAIGSIDEMKALAEGPGLVTPDAGFRSPYLLACLLGLLDKAKLLRPLTPEQARICPGKGDEETALHVAARGGDTDIVNWLITQGEDVNARDRFGGTPLLVAVENNHVRVVNTFLAEKADPLLGKNISKSLSEKGTLETGIFGKAASLIQKSTESFLDLDPPEDTITTPANAAYDPEIIRLLVEAGAPLEQFDEAAFPVATGANLIPPQTITPEIFNNMSAPKEGISNPQIYENPFYIEQIRSGKSGFAAMHEILGEEEALSDDAISGSRDPVWSFDRFGRTSTRLPDGRLVLIAGEHEDHYDPDFHIYNDVTILDGEGGVTYFIYPNDVFLPTDFHSATLLDDSILLIGNLGYQQNRSEGVTQVLRLMLDDFSIHRVETTGQNPGWINRHTAHLDANAIIVSGGKVEPGYRDLEGRFILDIRTMVWSRAA